MSPPKIARYMTRCPHSVEVGQPLEGAHVVMREQGIRHLPVLR